MARSKVELFEQIRRDSRGGRLSIRELAERHHTHRRTVRQALGNAVPPPRKAYPPRRRPAIEPYVEIVDGWPQGAKLPEPPPAETMPARLSEISLFMSHVVIGDK